MSNQDRLLHHQQQLKALQTHLSGGPLLERCLASWQAEKGLVWYPSSGNDYRDILELSPERLALHGLGRAPHLFIHTDVSDNWYNLIIKPDKTLVNLASTQAFVLEAERIKPSASLRQTVGLNDAYFANDKTIGGGWLMRICINSNKLGVHEAWMIRLECRNYDFFVRMVIEAGLRIDTFIQVRQGLGLGGCNLGTSHLLPWLTWAGVHEIICDGEFHGNEENFLKVANLFIDAGAPKALPYIKSFHHQRPFRWSQYLVDSAHLESSDPAPSLLEAWKHACADCAHPQSTWARR